MRQRALLMMRGNPRRLTPLNSEFCAWQCVKLSRQVSRSKEPTKASRLNRSVGCASEWRCVGKLGLIDRYGFRLESPRDVG